MTSNIDNCTKIKVLQNLVLVILAVVLVYHIYDNLKFLEFDLLIFFVFGVCVTYSALRMVLWGVNNITPNKYA